MPLAEHDIQPGEGLFTWASRIAPVLATCPHPAEAYRRLQFVTDPADVADLQARMALPATARVVRACSACYSGVASQVRRRAEQERASAEHAAAAASAAAAELAAIRAAGRKAYRHGACDRLLDEADLVPVRYCTHCEESFDASGGSNCETCNRPFTRRVTREGCPDCASSYGEDDDGEMEEIDG